MIVNENPRRNSYTISGSGSLPYTFGILDANDLAVIQDGIVLESHQYQVTGVGQDGGGTVVLLTAPADGTQVVIIGVRPYKQTSIYGVEAFPPQRLQNDFNSVVIQIQQLVEVIRRTPRLAVDSLFTVPPFPEPTDVDQFLRVASMNPFTLGWGTLGVLAGEVGIPLAMINGGTGAQYANAPELLQGIGAGRWGNVEITPSLDILEIPSPLPGNRVNVGPGNFSSMSTSGVAFGTLLILDYNAGGNLITDGAALQLQGRTTYLTQSGDKSLMYFNGGAWIELLRTPTPSIGNATKFLRGDGTYQQITTLAPSGVAHGLRVSNNLSDPGNDIDIAAGDAFSDDADPVLRVQMVSTGVFTKQLDNDWAAGSGNGGRVPGQTLANGTWHLFMFKLPGGAIDFCFTNNLTFVTPGGGTNRVIIMSVLREAGAIVPFLQEGDWVNWAAQTIQYDQANPGVAAIAIGMRSPLGLRCMVRYTTQLRTSSVAVVALMGNMEATDQVPALDVAPLYNVGLVNANHLTTVRQLDTMTNLSSQVRARLNTSDAGTRLRIVTEGFFHPRGRR